MFKERPGVLALLISSAAMAACGSEPTGESSTAESSEPIVGGSFTLARPEIGRLLDSNGQGSCAATLVDTRFAITAAHCIGYASGDVQMQFGISLSTGLRKYAIDKTFTLGHGTPGDNIPRTEDVGIVRIATQAPPGLAAAPVQPTDAIPTSISTFAPPVGSTQTLFGYGCISRDPVVAGPGKQFRSFTAGQTTQIGCWGDSGGPVVWGGPTSNGTMFAVMSGMDGNGNDVFGDVIFHGTPGLRAVKTLSNSFVTNGSSTNFAGWATIAGVKAVAGDFTGDGLTDIALVGGPGWTTIPVAASLNNGFFSVTNSSNSLFAGWGSTSNVRPVAGDFDGDGDADIALVGGPGWTTIPVAWSNRNGTFNVTNEPRSDFAGWAQQPGVTALAADFDLDGDADIALVGGANWTTIPVAWSNRTGTFGTTNNFVPDFPAWASQGAKAVVGNFTGDGAADIALTGVAGWGSIPVASSNKLGGFSVTNQGVSLFPGWAAPPLFERAPIVVAGDFNGDGLSDLALAGVPSWLTVAFAFSNNFGNFTPANFPMPNFPAWAGAARTMVAGRFNNSGFNDLVLVGGNGFGSIPVAFLQQ